MTINIGKNLAAYDWQTWIVGIWRSVVGGGAGAVAGSFGPMVTDPKDWNLGSGLGHVLESMVISFILVGIVHMMIFLQTHPAPELIQEPSQAIGKAAGQP